MSKPSNPQERTRRFVSLSIRKLKRELKAILLDVHREMRYIDLLFVERNSARTQVERDVVLDLIDRAKKMLETHQKRLDRYRECYRQFREKKSFDRDLLNPEELRALLKWPAEEQLEPCLDSALRHHNLRTGTDG